MRKINVMDLPFAVNVCEQVLREAEHQPEWSMAHVIMNPFAESLYHLHQALMEIYVVTRGYGQLMTDDPGRTITRRRYVSAGSVIKIPLGQRHMLRNMNAGTLEHLVFSFPPFIPQDVELYQCDLFGSGAPEELSLPKREDCFDGARILSYSFPRYDFSIAFGSVINDPKRHKQPHYHEKTTEYVYVVEGSGFVEIEGSRHPINSHDWLCIEPGKKHAFRNMSLEDLVVVCACSPMFQMEDVHY